MSKKALVVIDIQNDITKHYRDIIGNINAAVEWASAQGMAVVYIKHHNLSDGTRTFKPGTKGAELAPELNGASDNVFVKIVGRGLDERKKDYDTQLNFARQNEDNKKPCKVSEEFDNLIVTKFYKMLSWGLLIRGAKYERDRRGGTPEEEMLNGIIAEMEEKLKTLSVEVEEKTQYSVVDIKRLVGVQLESGMIVADYVKNNA